MNINSLNKEKDLDSYFDKLLNQKMDKERTKIFEMELKENNNNKNNLFPIQFGGNQEKNVNEIIKDINNKKKEEKMKKEQKNSDIIKDEENDI